MIEEDNEFGPDEEDLGNIAPGEAPGSDRSSFLGRGRDLKDEAKSAKDKAKGVTDKAKKAGEETGKKELSTAAGAIPYVGQAAKASEVAEKVGISKGKQILIGCAIVIAPFVIMLTVALSLYAFLSGGAEGTTKTDTSLFLPLGDKTDFSGYAPGEASDHIEQIPGHGTWLRGDAIDITVDDGSPVYAVFDGEVTAVTNDIYGHEVIHQQKDDSNKAIYAHVTPSVSEGQNVTKGTAIGTTNLGHLHFELMLNGTILLAGDMAAAFKSLDAAN